MQTASDLGKPATQALTRHLLDNFIQEGLDNKMCTCK